MDTITELSLGISILLGITLTTALIYRQVAGKFRWFFGFTLYTTCQAISEVIIRHYGSKTIYLYTYWLIAPGYVVLAVGATWESFVHMFAGFTRLKMFKAIVVGVAGAALLYSIAKAFIYPFAQAYSWLLFVMSVALASDYTLAALAGCFFLLMKFYRIPMRQRECWIIFGFGIIEALSALGWLIRSIFGVQQLNIVTGVFLFTFPLGQAIWLIGMTKPGAYFYDPEARFAKVDVKDVLADVDTYLGALKDFGKKSKKKQ